MNFVESSNFSKEDRALLQKYVTDVDKDIFAITGLPGIVGPIYARYSRAKGSFKETFLKEFIKEGILDQTRAQKLIDRILIAYGDDSVGELEGAHISFENVSNLATKEIEDRRIGGSPIEQSTRYILYDQKDAQGRWRYLRPKEILESEHAALYEHSLNDIFSEYSKLSVEMEAYYTRMKPINKAMYDIKGTDEPQKLTELTDGKDIKDFKRTYVFDLKTKMCDTIRIVLPTATQTNIGVFGNGRYFQHLLTHLYSSHLKEMNDIALQGHDALNKVIPVFVKRAKKNSYLIALDYTMQRLADTIFKNIAVNKSADDVILFSPVGVKAQTYSKYSEDIFTLYTIAAMLYKYVEHPFAQIVRVVHDLPVETKNEIIATYLGPRQTRRDRPGRALEYGYPFTFDITANFGIYRDLERHRMLTQMRQRLHPYLGFDHSEDIKEAGFQSNVTKCQEISEHLYEKIRSACGLDVAQYVVLFGHKLRFMMGMNLREAMHMLELRTIKQGHPGYRRICQIMHHKIHERSMWMGEALKFVDHNNYTWAREDSEAQQRVKERQWKKKYSI